MDTPKSRIALKVSGKMPVISKEDLYRIFQNLDKNHDGIVSLEELNWLLELIGVQLSLEELKSLVGISCLDYEQFMSFYNASIKPSGDGHDNIEDDVVKAFRVFDLNGDGVITCEELQFVLSRLGLWDENSGKDCRSMIDFYDANMDGVLDYEDFKNMML